MKIAVMVLKKLRKCGKNPYRQLQLTLLPEGSLF